MTGTDPRRRPDGLGWVTAAVFPDPRVAVTVGPAPAGYTVVAEYTVVPSVDRARFLLPRGSRRVAAASVLAYNALRPPKTRAARTALGTLARIGVTDLAGMPVLTVSVPSGVDQTQLLLTAHLAERLGYPRLHAALGLRPPDPNHKPTLQLFDDDAQPRGYAKLGWNDATRALVRAEAAAISALPVNPGGGYPVTPRLLASGEWAGQAYAVIEPLPADVRGLPAGTPPQVDAVLAIARRGGAAGLTRPLGASTYLSGLRERAGAAASAVPEPGRRALAAVHALADRDACTLLEFGDWHGDWVPWNLGRHGERLVAWDWEHSGPDVPVGFDLAHQGFQTALTLDGQPARIAATAADELLRGYGPALGLNPLQCRAVVDGYLVELWLRTWRLAAGGAGWNELLHPALLDLLDERLPAG